MYDFFHQLMNAGIMLGMTFSVWGLAVGWMWIKERVYGR